MSGGLTGLAAAEAEAVAARAKWSATLGELQQRLEPRRLAQDARQGIVEAGSMAVDQAKDVVVRRPGATAGIVAAAGLFLARHRVAALFGKRD